MRDAQYRGYSAQQTIERWASVRRGEERWVFPHQENADAMFNSALVYELAVLKPYVEPLLRQVEPGTLAYVNAGTQLARLGEGGFRPQPSLLAALLLLALLPWLGRLLARRLGAAADDR